MSALLKIASCAIFAPFKKQYFWLRLLKQHNKNTYEQNKHFGEDFGKKMIANFTQKESKNENAASFAVIELYS